MICDPPYPDEPAPRAHIITELLPGGCLLYMLPGAMVLPARRQRKTIAKTPKPRARQKKAESPAAPLVMKFGRWRGALVAEVVETEPSYCGWLMKQDWFFVRFPAEAAFMVQAMSATADTA